MSGKRPSAAITRREALTGVSAAAAFAYVGGRENVEASTVLDGDIAARVAKTPFVDTHEHLVEEARRTEWKPDGRVPCDDWALLFSHYLNSDLIVAGMPRADMGRFLSHKAAPEDKWPLLAPWWPAVKNTGYGRAVRIAMERLYGVGDLNAKTAKRVAEAYRQRVRPGFYEEILRGVAGIESCQVNSLEGETFMRSQHPALLMQDISILDLCGGGSPDLRRLSKPAGIAVKELADYHRVMDWWFAQYGPYAVAVKSQAAYARRLDFEDVPAEKVEGVFRRLTSGEGYSNEEHKALDDHLFWYCVRKATEHDLPVKLHTGYYAGENHMPLSRLMFNPADAAELARRAPDTTFVFMHVGYPYQEQMIALAKHWSNAVIDMCWAWIINPAASERFLRDFLMAAPANKVLTFGGDYIPVEPVVGHAAIARHGITRALTRLTEEGWLSRADAVELVEPLMRGNARRLFRLEEKTRRLKQAPWVK
jgi:hypothetical protein